MWWKHPVTSASNTNPSTQTRSRHFTITHTTRRKFLTWKVWLVAWVSTYKKCCTSCSQVQTISIDMNAYVSSVLCKHKLRRKLLESTKQPVKRVVASAAEARTWSVWSSRPRPVLVASGGTRTDRFLEQPPFSGKGKRQLGSRFFFCM